MNSCLRGPIKRKHHFRYKEAAPGGRIFKRARHPAQYTGGSPGGRVLKRLCTQ